MCVSNHTPFFIAFLLIIFNCLMRFKAIFPIKTLCMCIDSVPVSTQVTLLMTSSPYFPISGIELQENNLFVGAN